MRPFDPEHSPDPKKITVYRGVIFNPWVNIPACIVCTIGLAWVTWWLIAQYAEVAASAPHPDQGLDEAGMIIGIVVLGLATIAVFACTILTVRWWARRIRQDRERQGAAR